jgi:hypothetical protein
LDQEQEQEQDMEATSICGGIDKVLVVESKLEPIDILLGIFSCGIYTARYAKFYCK